MVGPGPLAMTTWKPGQAWKGAAVPRDSCADVAGVCHPTSKTLTYLKARYEQYSAYVNRAVCNDHPNNEAITR